jgi:hypothetical protein
MTLGRCRDLLTERLPRSADQPPHAQLETTDRHARQAPQMISRASSSGDSAMSAVSLG